jgi:glyceraldehyde 3-phosphate dehydrogenase
MNIAINGFGRIGRQCYRIIAEKYPDCAIVLINDLTDAPTLAHLLQFDSTYGRFAHEVRVDGQNLVTSHGSTRLTAVKDPAELPLKELNVDIVLECTGMFTSKEECMKHIQAGAKKVIISAPAKGDVDGTFCIGVNEHTYTPDMTVISNASCTTNCLAPMVNVLEKAFGIEHGFMTTVHSYTNDQRVLDLPHKDLRRARAAGLNMIPTTTGAAKAIGLVVPSLQGKLDGISIRVPTPTGSITDLTVQLKTTVTAEQVNAALKTESERIPSILAYETRPLVQSDYVEDSHSCTIDALSTAVSTKNGVTIAKILGWYDNEWGYSNRLVELARYVASKM